MIIRLRHLAVVGFGFLLAFAAFLHIERMYPYYLDWDMDFTNTIDSVAIESGYLPSHVHHTSFGLYLMHRVSAGIAEKLRVISPVTFDSLRTAISPLSVLALKTEFIRSFSPFMCLLYLLCFSIGLLCVLGGSSWVWVTMSLVLAAQPSLYFHAATSRSELYAFCFWSVGLLAVLATVRSRSARSTIVGLIVSGMLIGISFLTKIQSLAPCLLLLLVFAVYRSDLFLESSFLSALGLRWQKRMAVGLLFLFLILSLFSLLFEVGPGFGTFARRLNQPNFIFLLVLALLTWIIVSPALRRKWASQLPAFHFALLLVLSGFFLSFFAHLFMYFDLTQSWHYLLLDFKMIFLRKTYALSVGTEGAIHSPLGNFLQIFSANPILMLSALFPAIWVWMPWARPMGRLSKVVITASTLLVLLNCAVGVRGGMRDFFWSEGPLYLLAFGLGTFVLGENLGNKAKGFAVLGALLLLGSNLYKSSDIFWHPENKTLDADPFLTNVYAGDRTPYEEISKSFYSGVAGLKQRQIDKSFAARALEKYNFVATTFRLSPVDPHFIGPNETSSAIQGIGGLKIVRRSDLLRESILYDFIGNMRAAGKSSLKMTGRGDARIYIFSEDSQWLGGLKGYKCQIQALQKDQVLELSNGVSWPGISIEGSLCQISIEDLSDGKSALAFLEYDDVFSESQ